MIAELSSLAGLPLRTVTGQKLGQLDMAVFNGKEATLLGFQVARSGVVKKFAGLYFADLIDMTPAEAVVENDQVLKPNLRELDSAFHTFGAVVGVTAQTESGAKLGKVADLYLEMTTGGITRFHLRNLLQERIIPREYLVAITPERVVFKNAVNEPTFNKQVMEPARANGS